MSESTANVISFVIPLKDEAEALVELFDRIAAEMRRMGRTFEVVFIDDGSVDRSWEVIRRLAAQYPEQIVAHRFSRNAGKAEALAIGFRVASGGIVFTMDADLQDDPKEIPRFLEALEGGFDLVSGWKKRRHDPWHKVLPSRVFNWMVSSLLDVKLHDHNCGFKCFRAEVVKDLSLYGGMHRLIPALASLKGYRATEIEVQHHARRFGKSKYGFGRFFRGLADMFTIYLVKNSREQHLHRFRSLAVICAILGGGLFLAHLFTSLSPVLAGEVTAAADASIFGALGFVTLATFAPKIARKHGENMRRAPIAEFIQKRGFTSWPHEGSNTDRCSSRIVY